MMMGDAGRHEGRMMETLALREAIDQLLLYTTDCTHLGWAAIGAARSSSYIRPVH